MYIKFGPQICLFYFLVEDQTRLGFVTHATAHAHSPLLPLPYAMLAPVAAPNSGHGPHRDERQGRDGGGGGHASGGGASSGAKTQERARPGSEPFLRGRDDARHRRPACATAEKRRVLLVKSAPSRRGRWWGGEGQTGRFKLTDFLLFLLVVVFHSKITLWLFCLRAHPQGGGGVVHAVKEV